MNNRVLDKEDFLWDFLAQNKQKSTILLYGCILHRVNTSFNSLTFGWPNLAWHRLLGSEEFVTSNLELTAEPMAV